jgi:CheY-like chemotaxis protein
VILGNLTFLERGVSDGTTDEKFAKRLSYVRTAAERGATLTAQLLAFSRRQPLATRTVDLNEAISGMRHLIESTLGGSVHIHTLLRSGLWLALVDPVQIELVVLNLAINARDAMQVGGTLTIETENVAVRAQEGPEEPAPGEYVMVSVTDTGAGMSNEVLARAFEPFFTTKEIGKGSGLGLSQVLGFAKQSGGGVRLETRVGKGTSVKVYLPRATGAEGIGMHVGRGSTLRLVQRSGAVVLLVDDDSAVREVTASMLREAGYVVLEVGSGGAALELVEHRSDIEIAVVDFAMPGMNGVELARQLQSKRAALPIIFVTGYVDSHLFSDVQEERIVRKPFAGNELADKVGYALGKLRSTHSKKILSLR